MRKSSKEGPVRVLVSGIPVEAVVSVTFNPVAKEHGKDVRPKKRKTDHQRSGTLRALGPGGADPVASTRRLSNGHVHGRG